MPAPSIRSRRRRLAPRCDHRAAWIGFEPLEARVLLDAAEPTAFDQYMIELTNRARMAPAAEAARFGIDLNEGLPAGTLSSDPREPLAVNLFVTSAAQLHTADLFANFTQLPADHRGSDGRDPTQRVTDAAGMSLGGVAENNAFVSHSGPLTAQAVDRMHELLFKDFTANFEVVGRGHRKNILNFRNEVGAGVLVDNFGGRAATIATMDWVDVGKTFITGVVYTDTLLENNFYTPGEGVGGVTVTATRQSDGMVFTTTTFGSGGYNLEVPDGAYDIVAAGPALTVPLMMDDVTVAGLNEKVDFITGPTPGDLTAAVTSIALPAAVVAGDANAKGKINFTITNHGPGNTNGAIHIELIASTNDTLGDGDDVLLTTLTNQAINLVPLANKPFSVDVNLPPTMPEGIYRFFVRADTGSAILETNEANNDSAGSQATVNVAAAFVDLGITSVTSTFFDTLIPGDKGKVTVNVQHNGNIPLAGDVPILVELVKGGERLMLGTINAKLKLNPGQAKPLSLSVVLGQPMSEGEHQLVATLQLPPGLGDSNAVNDTATDARSYDVVFGFGNFAGRTGSAKFVMTQGPQALTFSLGGKDGSGRVIFDPAGDIDVELTGTTLASSAAVAVKGGSKLATLRNVTVDGSLKAFAGKPVDLAGNFTATGLVGKLDLHDVADNHLIAVQGAPDGATLLAVTMNNVQDLTLQSTIGIKSLAVANWIDTDEAPDTIIAPFLGKAASKGDFEASMELSDAAQKLTLGGLTVAGTSQGITLRSAGHIGALTFGRLIDSQIYAGIAPGVNGFPSVASAADFINPVSIKSVTLKGLKADATGAAFIHSFIAALKLESIKLGRIQLDNGGVPFGLAADTIKSATGADAATGEAGKFSNLDDPLAFEQMLIDDDIELGDFAIRLL